ncbi:hypothetical protein [Hymenobacter radiodurans]|uniref:hypothetical protein n=1 Tax=Hymenobacter radiodurans TaxID=2496028 RepID=UPI00105891A5|nr:hypothetical protein [Hymenobacter radiodurans]
MAKVREPGQPRRKVWTDFFVLLRRAARELGANDPLRLGAATAFFTTFALPPILIILIQVLGAFIRPLRCAGCCYKRYRICWAIQRPVW